MAEIHSIETEEKHPAKCDGLDVNEVADGYVVYQADRDRIHYLNTRAALVFELCDGNTSVEEIIEILGDAFELQNTPSAEVRDCLEKLAAEGMID